MKDRIKKVRLDAGLNQTEFGAAIGVAQTTIAGYENGNRTVPEVVIQSVCRVFEIREEWLRSGIEPMRVKKSREDEMGAEVGRLMADAPDSFKAALIATLLRFDPNGKEWEVLETIYKNLKKEMEKTTE